MASGRIRKKKFKYFEACSNKMILKIKAKPNSGKQEIEEKDGLFHIKLKESPENNKANIELINFLAKHFNKPVSEIKIIRGKTSHNKMVEIK
jgi:uncharacterized protein (TIGR00251 family)